MLVPLIQSAPGQKGHDELNVAQLSLISAQSRVPADYTSWTRTYLAGDKTVTVTCTAITGQVVPHGLDNDVMVAIINLYIADGCPEDGTVRVSLHQLLLAAGLQASAHYYREVRGCLRRLQSTSYQIVQGWWSQGRQRYTDATFNYLWKVTATREDEYDASSTLEIRLPDEVAQSIRQGYVKPLDLSLYRELSSPPVRAVYRVLDALRWESGAAQDRVEVNLLEWGERLSIYSKEPDKIRRVLQPAHHELVERGILQTIELEGKGKTQKLTYVFTPVEHLPDPELLQALIQRGMYPAVAGKYLTDQPDLSAIRLALGRFDAYPSKKNNAGALLRDMLMHPERYAEVASFPPAAETKATPRKKPSATDESEAASVEAQQRAELQTLPREKQAERLERQLSFSGVTLHLTVMMRDQLRAAVLNGQLSVPQVIQTLARTMPLSAPERAAAVLALLPETDS
ncbi:replication initiator protein A [Deinococcus rubellus]|uniref:replication initiator protein A n=1 Tax=Deinococcus rubellus TaxID=1889240 RepID=UPI0031E500DD